MNKKDLPKAYEPQMHEEKIYKRWDESGFFNPDNLPPLKSSGKAGLPGKRTATYSISLPPPNVTGILHIGHAMMLAIQDLLIRYKRLQGYKTLWLPGVDHAAIATQTKVEKILLEEKKKSRHDLGREKFLVEVEKYVKTTRETIISQIKKMGSSLDWSRMAYTLDDDRTLAVRTVFKRMYDDGLIYRGDRIVNWCPRCASTLADDEVEYKDEAGKLYYIKYGPLIIATTRPETKIGDTGAAVHPDDKRYKKYIGKELDIPLGKINIKIKVIADEEVDLEFGTGVVGVTPAHSQVDFEMAERHGLAVKKIIGEDGKMTSLAGSYAGLEVSACREAFIKDMESAGLIEKIEDYNHQLSICYRCSTPIEPLTSKQWFIDVNKKVPGKGKSLKQMSLEVVREGDIKIIPERFEKTYYHWMDNLRDWCISRQIWFGHQIPVWYKGDKVHVGVDAPKGKGWEQDPDTLDTWFSSGLWTFSTLGWPKETEDLKNYHPTSVLETAPDILFFWVARMILMTTYVLDEIPFRDVYLHGLVRDEKGKKMSKSLGNAINPVDVADKYGTDAVRLSLLIGNSPGNDVKLSEEKIASFRNFTNKLWNISRFILTSVKKSAPVKKAPKPKTLADKWILSRFSRVKEQVEKFLEEYQFSAAGELLRDFTWNELADWYLEISKVEKNKDEILIFILERLLVMWHPFMPFVTEHIWSHMGDDLIMVHSWPEDQKKLIDAKAEKEFSNIQELVVKIRNLRSVYNISPAQKIDVLISAGTNNDLLKKHADVIKALARVRDLTIESKVKKPEQTLTAVVGKITAYIPTEGVIDLEKELARLKAEAKNLENYTKGLKTKLDNVVFVSKAPKEIIDAEKVRLEEANEKLEKLNDQIKSL
jgi:valyl-tRNA synthetase